MDNLACLRNLLVKLSPGDREFAASLLEQSRSRGLSVKQLEWVDRLIERATAPSEKAIMVAPIVAMFDRAGGALKLPKVRVDAGGMLLRLTLAGGQSRAPGSIVITSPERAYHDRTFYGRVMRDGMVQFGRDTAPDVKKRVGAALMKLATDPEGAARAYGRKLGQCCFCGIELSDPASVAIGYGPVCARNFSLPWGRYETTSDAA